jgi:16S rRNA (adenine1518-N6/adenine1519-N6)-dimethyltransferase
VRSRRQRMGQHFLRDHRVAQAIVEALPAGEPARAIEVGPGRGALTRPLLARFPHVRAIELDHALAQALPAVLGAPAGLEMVLADAVTADLEVLASGGPWLLAGNLPYSVGTPIVRRVIRRGDLVTAAVVMVQLEVARRLVACPGGRDRGLLTLEVEGYAEAELLFTVPPRCFAPPPRVVSAVVRLRIRRPDEHAPLLEAALRLAAAAFTHRRKKLPNALAGAVPPEALAPALGRAGVDPGARAEDLALAQWLALAAAIAHYNVA